jgi:hypothetical protein
VASLCAEKVAFGATVVISEELFERHTAFSPGMVGRQLAEQLDRYARTESLGYYPALSFLQQQCSCGDGLMGKLDQLTWFATSLVHEEVRTRLRPLFASLQVQSIQALVYSMPPLLPGQPNALDRLAEHLTPNRVRFSLLLTLFRKAAARGSLEDYVKGVSQRHLKATFDSIQITNVEILDQSGVICRKW